MASLRQIVKLASDQFQVANATECIQAVQNIEDVFSPPHHGPMNIPIKASNIKPGENYTHFPIVTPGTYYLFLPHREDDVEVTDMHYNGPSQQLNHEGNRYYPIELEKLLPIDLRGTPFKNGFKSKLPIVFNQGNPQPIAIHFETLLKEANYLKYIVVGEPTCEDS